WSSSTAADRCLTRRVRPPRSRTTGSSRTASRSKRSKAAPSAMPYRVDLPGGGADALDRLVELDALDVEISHGDAIAALIPDSVTPERVARALGVATVAVSPAQARDDGSVWVLS